MKTTDIRVCVPVTVERISSLPEAINRAAEFGDLVELRLDYLLNDERERLVDRLPSLVTESSRPLILTLRPVDQGGQSLLDLSDRLEFWFQVFGNEHCYFDLELDVMEQLRARKATVDSSRIICSHHDFRGVPGDLEKIYERMAATRAGVAKIAVAANEVVDCISVFQLLNRAQSEGLKMIAIAMGQAGIASRILGPSRGSFLTYASIEDESATAPGQITSRQMRELYRIDRIDDETEIFGLMGSPVSHSISPHVHNAAFAEAERNAVYLPLDVREPGPFLRRMIHPRSREFKWNLRGLSVTAPHKLAVMQHLDWIDAAARTIGAVNTIVVQGRELHGYNTDAQGFIAPLHHKLGSLKNLRCAIIGGGGAARAALYELYKEEARMEVFLREPNRPRHLTEEFGATCKPLAEADFNGLDVVVNATPLGTLGDLQDETPATALQLRNVRLVYDLVYNPLETRLLREARSAGCETVGGVEMLATQAAAQFKLWTGKKPNLELMRAAAMRALSTHSEHHTSRL